MDQKKTRSISSRFTGHGSASRRISIGDSIGEKKKPVRPIRVLLTGFRPFGRCRVNPSGIIVRQFRLSRSLRGHDIAVKRVVLSANKDVLSELRSMVHVDDFDIVLHTGLGVPASAVRLEHIAYNKVKSDLRDQSGRRRENRSIASAGPWILKSNLPFVEIHQRFLRENIPYTDSTYAGNHICNFLLYSSLLRTRKSGKKQIVGFLHVPDSKYLAKNVVSLALDAILIECARKHIEKQNARDRLERLRTVVASIRGKLFPTRWLNLVQAARGASVQFTHSETSRARKR